MGGPGLIARLAPLRTPRPTMAGAWSYIGEYDDADAAYAAYADNHWTRRTGDRFGTTDGLGLFEWDGSSWGIRELYWDGVTAGQLLEDLPTDGVLDDAVAFVGDTAWRWTGAAWEQIGETGDPLGSIGAPYKVSVASVAAALVALAALGAANGEYATVIVTGSAARLMQYVSADSAWYGTDGGDGSELAPYWTATTDEDGIDALPAPTSGLYAVIGKGTGAAKRLRGWTLLATGWATAASASAGVLQRALALWVSPTLYARGTPSTAYLASRTISPWTTSVGAGGAINYSSAVANRIAVRSGTAASSTMSLGTRSTSTALALLITRARVTGTSIVSGGLSYVRTMSTSDANQFSGVGAGGSTAPNATEWVTWGPAGTLVATGITCDVERRIESILDLATNALEIRVNGADTATFSTTSIITTSSTSGAEVTASVQGGAQTTIAAEMILCMEWN